MQDLESQNTSKRRMEDHHLEGKPGNPVVVDDKPASVEQSRNEKKRRDYTQEDQRSVISGQEDWGDRLVRNLEEAAQQQKWQAERMAYMAKEASLTKEVNALEQEVQDLKLALQSTQEVCAEFLALSKVYLDQGTAWRTKAAHAIAVFLDMQPAILQDQINQGSSLKQLWEKAGKVLMEGKDLLDIAVDVVADNQWVLWEGDLTPEWKRLATTKKKLAGLHVPVSAVEAYGPISNKTRKKRSLA
jgi:hypothetical protein